MIRKLKTVFVAVKLGAVILWAMAKGIVDGTYGECKQLGEDMSECPECGNGSMCEFHADRMDEIAGEY